jgi:hypothetical protein
MSCCAKDLARAGLPRPRTCGVCGLGPCRDDPPSTRPATADDLAARIAATVFPHVQDQQRRDSLADLLFAFAAEIRRSAIEP